MIYNIYTDHRVAFYLITAASVSMKELEENSGFEMIIGNLPNLSNLQAHTLRRLYYKYI